MLLVSMDNRLMGGIALVAIVGWVIFKVVEAISAPSGPQNDARPTCNRCGDLLPSGQTNCISCGHQPPP